MTRPLFKQVSGEIPEASRRQVLEAYRARTEPAMAEAYLEIQPLFTQGRIELLDHSGLVRELKLLEARPRAGGKTQVDHLPGRHTITPTASLWQQPEL